MDSGGVLLYILATVNSTTLEKSKELTKCRLENFQ